jgi:hypothetical protein
MASEHKSLLTASALKVGAVCGSTASTDLCGGHPAMGVPTATSVRAASWQDLARAVATTRQRRWQRVRRGLLCADSDPSTGSAPTGTLYFSPVGGSAGEKESH